MQAFSPLVTDFSFPLSFFLGGDSFRDLSLVEMSRAQGMY